MKKLFIFSLLILSYSPVYATQFSMSWGTYTSQVPKNQRVALVWDAHFSAASNNNVHLGMQPSLGAFITRLKDHGVEPTILTWEYLEDTVGAKKDFPGLPSTVSNRRYRWEKLGDNYGAVIMLNIRNRFGITDSTQKRYFRADSTNIQIIHFGDIVGGWKDEPGLSTFCAATACSLTSAGVLGGTERWVMSVGNVADTLGGFNIPFELRTSVLYVGVKEVVRYFNLPYQIANNPRDSVCASGDTMAYAWKVRFSNSGYSSAVNPVTEYVPSTNNSLSSSGYSAAPMLWAILSKYVFLEKIKIAINWDDIGNFGLNPSFPGTPSNRPENFTIIRAARLDSIFKYLNATYNMKPTVSAEADSLVFYMSGGYTAGNFNFIKRWKMPVILHAHNGDSTNVYSAIMGRCAASVDSTGNTIQSRRVGHAYAPANASVYLRYGIYDRIRLSDSLLTTNGLSVGPWMDFPNDTHMSPNVNKTNPAGELTYDSLFAALYDARKLYIRSNIFQATQENWTGNSATPTNWFSLPNAIYTTAGGKIIQNVGAVSITGAPQTINNLRGSAQIQPAAILGFVTGVPRGTVAGPGLRPAYNYGETSITQFRNVDLWNYTLTYVHPKNFTDLPTPGVSWYNAPDKYGEADYTALRVILLSQLNCLKYLAGNKDIHTWVFPWQTLTRSRSL